jgi:hypothetical protein
MNRTLGFFVSAQSWEAKSKARKDRKGFFMFDWRGTSILLSGKKTGVQGLKSFPSLFPWNSKNPIEYPCEFPRNDVFEIV